MSESANEEDSTSNTKLIEVQHVGVTAKIISPLHNFLPASSFYTETENSVTMLNGRHSTYNKFSNSSPMDTEETESSKVLYEMRTIRPQRNNARLSKMNPSKIEFQLHRRPFKATRRRRNNYKNTKVCAMKQYENEESRSFLKRIFCSFTTLWTSRTQQPTCTTKKQPRKEELATQQNEQLKTNFKVSKQASPCLLFEEPFVRNSSTQTVPLDTYIGIYHFEQGCDDYLRTTDYHPQVLADALAVRTTQMATRFWAEIFGTLHVGVAFFITFFLQTYRFVLFSLINTFIVAFVLMTSDYLIKPLLTVLFNALMQPIFTLIYNICKSLKDIGEPIAQNCINFVKPFATFAKSCRLIDVKNVQRKIQKTV